MADIKSESERNYCKDIAEVIFKQLFLSINKWTFCSWGVSMQVCIFFEDMPTLALKVSGLLHKGWVFISLDECSDTYTITLKDRNNMTIKTLKDVYCDNLGEVVDGLVERSPKFTTAEYKELALRDSKRKLTSNTMDK